MEEGRKVWFKKVDEITGTEEKLDEAAEGEGGFGEGLNNA